MSELKYKVGDIVRIKSIGWYNENKDEYGYIDCGSRAFFTKMSALCGKVATIKEVCKYNCYRLEEYDFDWTDEMIECKVEEKIKPKFKAGDKVKDKNNRVWFIVRVTETFFDISSAPNSQGYFVPIDDQDEYELVPQCFSHDIENNMKNTMEINGFSESQIIGLLRIAIELAGDGGCNPWTNLEETAMREYLDYLESRM